ncbi:MAG: hypothetical protein A3J40_13345 [Erythrobacter sp. RIFCSPHIGHO2_12_FULL_63_10]|nr:MAG: hypothetical protein A3J40_13345 [Erythrobacter sp. RIFCSPHIGHO2_12_FULL_63_10]
MPPGPSSPAKLRQAPDALALAALAWILEDAERAQRLLALTGLEPATLRGALGENSTLVAVLEFLANHEPDLLRAAEALAVTPEELIAAMEVLRR